MSTPPSVQALYPLSDEATEFIFGGLRLRSKTGCHFNGCWALGSGTAPDATMAWLFPERQVNARATDELFAHFDATVRIGMPNLVYDFQRLAWLDGGELRLPDVSPWPAKVNPAPAAPEQ